MKNICSGEKRGMLKFAIACAMMVSSVAFAASPGYADTIINIDNRTDGEGGIVNSAYYNNPASQTTLNVMNSISGDTEGVGTNLPTISNAVDFTIRGMGESPYTIGSRNRDDGWNRGYTISNSSVNISNLTFDSFGVQESVPGFNLQDVSAYGAGLSIDELSSVSLNGVSFTNSRIEGEGNLAAHANFYGGAISNSGSLIISGGIFSANELESTNRYSSRTGGNAYGGAIYNTGSLTLTGVTISGNSVVSQRNEGSALGGGIYTTKGITLAGGNLFSNNTDRNGTRNNDIYFADGSNLNVNGTGSDEYNIISGGIASASGDSTIVITAGGKLRLEGNNSDFSGGATVAGEGSVLTYAGSLNDSILKATTTVNMPVLLMIQFLRLQQQLTATAVR